MASTEFGADVMLCRECYNVTAAATTFVIVAGAVCARCGCECVGYFTRLQYVASLIPSDDPSH